MSPFSLFQLPKIQIVKRAARWSRSRTKQIFKNTRLALQLPNRVASIKKELRMGRIDFDVVRSTTLEYVAANRIATLGPGVYSYKVGGPPLVYASAYAALLRSLYGDLESLSTRERNDWAAYLLNHQSEDGLFRDPQIACSQAEAMDWWGWRHMTLHVLMALSALGGPAARSLRCIDHFSVPGKMAGWLATLNWTEDAATVSNQVQNYGTMLQYARDFQDKGWCEATLNEMFDWLDHHQDGTTGCWGYPGRTPWQRSQAVQTGYHFWCLYFYDNRPIRHVEKIIDSCLSTQNRLGGFGVQLNSSACEDIDSIDPLVRFSLSTRYRRNEVRASLERALPWVLVNHNRNDGGWVFKRHQPYSIVPHKTMWAGTDESLMPYTWFRTLSLAYLAKALPDSPIANLKWNIGKFPGHQFW